MALPLEFPASPTDGDIFTSPSGQKWIWVAAGPYWKVYSDNISVGSNVSVNTTAFTVGNSSLQSTSLILGGQIVANGSSGSAGQVLHSNGAGVYWAADDQGVTSVATGSGLTGGTITTTGTISVLANSGIAANATGVYVVPGNGLVAANSTGVHVGAGSGISVNTTAVSVLANNGITANTAGLYVTQGTGIVVNSTGVHVNSAYVSSFASGVNTAATYAWSNIHSFSSNVNFDSGTLFVDSATNRVGVGTNAPTYTLDVEVVTAGAQHWFDAIEGGPAYYGANGISGAEYRTYVSGVQYGRLVTNSTAFALVSTNAVPTILGANNINYVFVAANGSVGIGNSAPAHTLRVEGSVSLSGGVHANGSLGTSGHVLHSNGTGVYWAADDAGVTSVATGSGLTGGTITTTGTVSVLANNGITANATGLYVTQGTGTVVNATGVHVNSTYIGTLTANNSTNLNGQPASFYTNATNISTGTLAWARAPTNTVNTTGAFTITGIHTHQANVVMGNTTVNSQFSNATILISNSTSTTTLGLADLRIGNTTTNVVISNTTSSFGGSVSVTGNLTISSTGELVFTNGSGIYANGTLGTSGQFLTSNGTGVYWSTATASVNTAAQYTWTNVHTFSANVVFSAGISANGSYGSNGQILTSNGTGAYWRNGSNVVRQSWTANSTVNTTFTVTGGYTPGSIDVYRNGVKLVNGSDVTVTSGTSIVLATAAANGDTIDAVGITSTDFTDVVKKSGDTMTGKLNFTSDIGATKLNVYDNASNGNYILSYFAGSNGSPVNYFGTANGSSTVRVVSFGPSGAAQVNPTVQIAAFTGNATGGDVAASYPVLQFERYTGNTTISAATPSGVVLSGINTYGSNSTSALMASYIDTISEAAFTVGAQSALRFFTANTSGIQERARITSAGMFQFNSGYGSVATAYGCRAWVNFNGTGTVAIRGSGNVTSITDNGVGDYTVNFTNAMPDANYAYSHAYSNEVNVAHTVGFLSSYSSTALRVAHYNVTNSAQTTDKANVFIAVFR